VAVLYSVDVAEVRLPVPDADLAALDVDLAGAGAAPGAELNGHASVLPRVLLRADFAGGERQWQGAIVRSEGEIDPKTRMVHLIAEVADPYVASEANGGVPLAVGLFVRAEVLGRTLSDVIVLPRTALRGGGEVLVVDGEQRLWRRRVEVLRAERDIVYIGDGIGPDERVCLSPMAAVVDGMRVRIAPGTSGEDRP
jgi:multidrug efflux pump subunit AcrA (membrane-fusion protein)